MQTFQNRHIAETRAVIGEPPRLEEQPRAPSDGKVSKGVSDTATLRDFIAANSESILHKAKLFCRGHRQDAEDISQELYPRMLRALELSAAKTIEYPWACAHQILARLAIDHFRKEFRTRSRIKRLEFPDSIPDEPPNVPDTSEQQRAMAALESLPFRQKFILTEIFFEGQKAKDVASRMRLSESRLAELKHLGLKKLREVLA